MNYFKIDVRLIFFADRWTIKDKNGIHKISGEIVLASSWHGPHAFEVGKPVTCLIYDLNTWMHEYYTLTELWQKNIQKLRTVHNEMIGIFLIERLNWMRSRCFPTPLELAHKSKAKTTSSKYLRVCRPRLAYVSRLVGSAWNRNFMSEVCLFVDMYMLWLYKYNYVNI